LSPLRQRGDDFRAAAAARARRRRRGVGRARKGVSETGHRGAHGREGDEREGRRGRRGSRGAARGWTDTEAARRLRARRDRPRADDDRPRRGARRARARKGVREGRSAVQNECGRRLGDRRRHYARPTGAPAARASVMTTPIAEIDRKSTRLNSSHGSSSYAVFCLKKKKKTKKPRSMNRIAQVMTITCDICTTLGGTPPSTSSDRIDTKHDDAAAVSKVIGMHGGLI